MWRCLPVQLFQSSIQCCPGNVKTFCGFLNVTSGLIKYGSDVGLLNFLDSTLMCHGLCRSMY